MSERTSIEWCDATFNPWIGCVKVSAGCDHCYAERSTPARTLGIVWGPREARHPTAPANWQKPRRWNANADAFEAEHGRRRRVFCASLADVFDNQAPPGWREALLRLVMETPRLDWLVLTKRVGNVVPQLREVFDRIAARPGCLTDPLFGWLGDWLNGTPPAHVWLGITVVDQPEATRDLPKLAAVPAALRWVSFEPLLGGVSVIPWLRKGVIDWGVVGGESGPQARPMLPWWVRSLRRQFTAVAKPLLMKQWGEWLPVETITPELGEGYALAVDGSGRRFTGGLAWTALDDQEFLRVGKRDAGRLLDGVLLDAFPEPRP